MSVREHALSRLAQAAHAAVDPEGFFRARAAKHGDPFWVAMPGLGRALLTGHPAGAEQIFSAPPSTFARVPNNPVEPLLGPGSMILLDGERHRAERKLVMPALHGERMRAYGDIIRDAARAELARFAPGDAIDLSRLTQSITLEVIVRAIFGVEGAERGRAVRDAVVALMDAYTAPLLLVPALRRSIAGRGPWAAFRRARARFDELLRGEIARRRADADAARSDILSLLLGLRYEDGSAMSDDALLDELRTLLVAGHETTATALAWALWFAHRDPAIERRVRAEVQRDASPDALARANYLGAVCSEALRLHPVVPIVLRQVREPFSLCGVSAPAGSIVGVAVSVLHARPDVWAAPDRFEPDHFVERRYTPFEYAPFGGGHRRCMGAAFAAYEMRIALGTLLAEASFAAVDDARRPRPVIKSITTGPSRPLRLRYASTAPSRA